MSDQFVLDVEAEERLYWASNGVQKNQSPKDELRNGYFNIEGFFPEEAKETMLKIKIALEELINSESELTEKLDKNKINRNYFRTLGRGNQF